MRRFDRGTLRAAAFTALVTGVFLVVNTSVAQAADSSGTNGSGDLLSPLNIDSSEGMPVQGYELRAQSGSLLSASSQACAMVLTGLFTIIKVLVGLACWAVEFAFRFPLIKLLADPAQEASDAYHDAIVDTLGLKGLMLSWAFVFGLILFVRGKVGKGLGEIVLTLLISGLAASAFVRPDYLLAQDGPLAQSQRAAAEVSKQTSDSYDWGGPAIVDDPGPCTGMHGAPEQACLKEQEKKPVPSWEVARPIQDATTNALLVKPYMLLQYGRILDPDKATDKKAYAVHIKWVSGGYRTSAKTNDDRCDLLRGPARKYCEQGGPDGDDLPKITPGDALLDTPVPIIDEDDRQFALFLKDLENAGKVGKAAAGYAKQPTWWRAAGACLLLIAALLICAILLSCAMVLLGTQAADAGAAAGGVLAFVWGMLPGPNRAAVWKWLALFAISIAVMFGVCMFLPIFGMGIDVVLTDGPGLAAERILLLDVLALLGLVFHRWMLATISAFGRTLAIRMRFAKVGGTHLPGDTSEIGAALAMNSGAGHGGYALGGGLRGLGGAGYGSLGTRQRLMGHLGGLTDSTGMPVDTQRMLGDGLAEATRGLAPLGIGAVGARLGVRGAWGLAVGNRPDEARLEKWRKPTAAGDDRRPPGGAPDGSGALLSGRGGPADRYRDEDGAIADRNSGELLHDQHADRTLLSTRAHNRLVRLRGYRILHRTGRVAYSATYGYPATLRSGIRRATQYTQDTRQQLQVWGNTLREDGRQWQPLSHGIATGARSAAAGARRVRRGLEHAAQRRDAAARLPGPGARRESGASGTGPGRGAGGDGAASRRRIREAFERAARAERPPVDPPSGRGREDGDDA